MKCNRPVWRLPISMPTGVGAALAFALATVAPGTHAYGWRPAESS